MTLLHLAGLFLWGGVVAGVLAWMLVYGVLSIHQGEPKPPAYLYGPKR